MKAERGNGRARLSERAAVGLRAYELAMVTRDFAGAELNRRTARSDGPYHKPRFLTADGAFFVVARTGCKPVLP